MSVSDYLAAWSAGLPTAQTWLFDRLFDVLVVAAICRIISALLYPRNDVLS